MRKTLEKIMDLASASLHFLMKLKAADLISVHENLHGTCQAIDERQKAKISVVPRYFGSYTSVPA